LRGVKKRMILMHVRVEADWAVNVLGALRVEADWAVNVLGALRVEADWAVNAPVALRAGVDWAVNAPVALRAGVDWVDSAPAALRVDRNKSKGGASSELFVQGFHLVVAISKKIKNLNAEVLREQVNPADPAHLEVSGRAQQVVLAVD
jgi:hypothetical protein